MKAPSKALLAAGIVAAALTLGGLGFGTTAAVRAQLPATPTAGHDSMSMDHPSAQSSATPACVGTPTGNGTGSMSHAVPPGMMATPGDDRQTQVAATGAHVMPFDLNRTTHTFTDLPDGGRETVTANDPNDTEQIALIRAHLQMEAHKFSTGDFSDPAAIHGNDMPGLAQLRAGFAGIEFQYEELPNGAAITYGSEDPALVSALYTWFAAQRSDHGSCQMAP